MTDTEASTLLICIFRLTIPNLCKACIVYEEYKGMNIIFKPVFPCQRQPVLDSENFFYGLKLSSQV